MNSLFSVSANLVINHFGMKKTFSLFALSMLVFATACQTAEPSGTTESPAETGSPTTVVTSFYPLYFFTSEIAAGAQNVDVINLIPSGAEPHTYEPYPSQLAQMEESELVIAQGAGLEPWLEGLEHELEENGVKVLEINSHLELMSFDEEEDHHDHDHDDHEEEEHDDHDHKDEHAHGEFDPHTWLDPVLAMEIVEHITEELTEVDPANAELFLENSLDLLGRLAELHSSFEEGLASCELDAILTSHDAFAYLANRYGLHAHPVAGVSPFDEPSAKQLAELIEIAEDDGVEHIFFEVLANPEAAQVLQEEAGLTALTLNPLSGLTADQAEVNYFTMMKENLQNLKTGLACD